MIRRGHLLAGVVIAMLIGTSACAAAPSSHVSAAPAAPTRTSVALTDWETQMMSSLNAQRAAVGVGPLAPCATLRAAAQAHSADQAATNTMTHSGSNGSNIGQRADAAGYSGWMTLGENVAYGFTSVDSVMTAWMNSPGHKANILNPAFKDVGLGMAASDSGVQYWTQDFGGSGHC